MRFKVWNVVIRNFVASYDPLAREAAARLAFTSSPVAYLDGWRSPVLLIHGDDDRNVPFSETVTLVEELRKRKVESSRNPEPGTSAPCPTAHMSWPLHDDRGGARC